MKRDLEEILSAVPEHADIMHVGPDLVVWGRLMSDSSLLRKQLTALPREETGYHGSLQVARSAAVRIFAHIDVLIRENNAAEQREADAIQEAIDRADKVAAVPRNGPVKVEDNIDAVRLVKLRAIASIICSSGQSLTATVMLARMRGPNPDMTGEALMDLLCFLEREELAKSDGTPPRWTLTRRGVAQLTTSGGAK